MNIYSIVSQAQRLVSENERYRYELALCRAELETKQSLITYLYSQNPSQPAAQNSNYSYNFVNSLKQKLTQTLEANARYEEGFAQQKLNFDMYLGKYESEIRLLRQELERTTAEFEKLGYQAAKIDGYSQTFVDSTVKSVQTAATKHVERKLGSTQTEMLAANVQRMESVLKLLNTAQQQLQSPSSYHSYVDDVSLMEMKRSAYSAPVYVTYYVGSQNQYYENVVTVQDSLANESFYPQNNPTVMHNLKNDSASVHHMPPMEKTVEKEKKKVSRSPSLFEGEESSRKSVVRE